MVIQNSDDSNDIDRGVVQLYDVSSYVFSMKVHIENIKRIEPL